MPADADLPRLADAARGGDQDAWNALVARYAPLVWGVARGHGLNVTAAADVAQTTWLRLVEHLRDIADDELGSWLAARTREESVRALRWIDPRADREPVRGGEAALLWSAVGQLPARARLAARLVAVQPPLSHDELAAAVGLDRSQAAELVRDALDRLARLLPAPSSI